MARSRQDRAARRRQIEKLLRQREERCESLRSVSERSGIPVGTLSWWQHRLRHGAVREDEATVELVEVQGLVGDVHYEIAFGEVTVRVPPQFDPESLATLLQVLSEC
jgi:hypothetical protein